MAAGLRSLTAVLAVLSICFCITVMSCASDSVRFFNDNQETSVWLLPLWRNHFNMRELYALIGGSVAIMLLNAVLLICIFIAAVCFKCSPQKMSYTMLTSSKQVPANIIALAMSLFSTAVSIIVVAFPAVLNYRTGVEDTLQTWTCQWSITPVSQGQGPPEIFDSICQETRYAFWATVPICILQLMLLGVAVFVFVRSAGGERTTTRGWRYDEEKNLSQHELKDVRQVSFETKSESRPSTHAGPRKGVQFA